MSMSPGLRKLVLTAHITCAVAWVGTVVAFLVLATTGVTSHDLATMRAMYVAMALLAQYAIVPLSFVPLITGTILSLGTPWGLVRHYWILVKLGITILCTLILQLHLPPIAYLANAATLAGTFGPDLYRIQVQMVVASAAALLALIVVTALGVYKPRGMTPYGWRKLQERQALSQS